MKDKRLDELYQYIEEREAKWRIDHLKRYEYEDRINKAIDFLNNIDCIDFTYLINILKGDKKLSKYTKKGK